MQMNPHPDHCVGPGFVSDVDRRDAPVLIPAARGHLALARQRAQGWERRAHHLRGAFRDGRLQPSCQARRLGERHPFLLVFFLRMISLHTDLT